MHRMSEKVDIFMQALKVETLFYYLTFLFKKNFYFVFVEGVFYSWVIFSHICLPIVVQDAD